MCSSFVLSMNSMNSMNYLTALPIIMHCITSSLLVCMHVIIIISLEFLPEPGRRLQMHQQS